MVSSGLLRRNLLKATSRTNSPIIRQLATVAVLCLVQSAAHAGVVISEFRTRGPVGGSDEFIELYNNSDDPVDISGWKINGSNSSGSTTTRLTINAGTTIRARGHFLAVNSTGYSGTVSEDQTYGTGITDDGGIALLMADNTMADQVGMSSGSAYKEGTTLTPLATNTDQSYERKAGGTPGSAQDTDDNASDFQVRAPSDPQNAVGPGVVTSTNDSGPGSLRQTLASASDGITITFALSFPATIQLTNGELVIDRKVTINGPGADLLRVTGSSNQIVFHISPSNSVTISKLYSGRILNDHGTLSVSDCTITGPGTAVSNGGSGEGQSATLTINRCKIIGSGEGGGVLNNAVMTVNSSTISGNFRANYFGASGGGISNSGMLTVNDSTISSNYATSFPNNFSTGGGIANVGTPTINNSTISGNVASYGGGIFNGGMLTIHNSTISDNFVFSSAASGFGGGIYNDGASTRLEIGNSILKTGSSGENILNNGGTVTSAGYNLSNDNTGGFLTATGDRINTDPLLGPLQNNGGPTLTCPLLSGSPAIDAGGPNSPARDQRGYFRNNTSDIGVAPLNLTADLLDRYRSRAMAATSW
jgi:hypothetical protein